MKKTLLACLILLLSAGSASAQESANVVYKDNSVKFTVISGGTLRMEYSSDVKFTDNRSFVAVDRQYPSVRYRVKAKVVIQTDDLMQAFNDNLKDLPAILKDQKLSDVDCQWFFHEVLGPNIK